MVVSDELPDKNPIMVKKSGFEGAEGGSGNKAALGAGEEVQVVPPPMASHQIPAFGKTLLDSSPYYERLKRKRPISTVTAPPSCEEHPFFEGFSNLFDSMKSFYNELFSDEGDIFCDCPVVWPALRTIIINGLFEFAQRLEQYMITGYA